MNPIKKPITTTLLATMITLYCTGFPPLSASPNHHDHQESTEKTLGPNGGTIITVEETPFEFLVTEERKVKITFLNDQKEPIPPTAQRIGLIGGDRFNPTELKFSKNGNHLLSDKTLPEESKIPVILIIQLSPSSKVVRVRFNYDLDDCSSCKIHNLKKL